MDSHNSCKKKRKKNSRHTEKKIRQFCFRSTRKHNSRATHTRAPFVAIIVDFRHFKTKVRNQHASSGDQDRMFDNRLEFDQEQFFGTDETFFKKIWWRKRARARACVCTGVCAIVIYGITCRPCSTQLAFSFQRRFHVFQFEYFLFFFFICLSTLVGRVRSVDANRLCLVHTSGRIRSKIETSF